MQIYTLLPTSARRFQPIWFARSFADSAGDGKVVLARTVIQSDRAEVRRMLIGYTNGVEVYANGQPLFFGMNPIVQPAMSWMNMIGDGVYVPLKQGRNEVVFAVTDLTAGWGFWARLDP